MQSLQSIVLHKHHSLFQTTFSFCNTIEKVSNLKVQKAQSHTSLKNSIS